MLNEAIHGPKIDTFDKRKNHSQNISQFLNVKTNQKKLFAHGEQIAGRKNANHVRR